MIEASVIIPTYNRCDALRETLEALAQSTFPHEKWEAIVVDDGSPDDIEEVVRNVAREKTVQLKYVRQENAGPAAARNRGAREARGSALIFIDNDIIVEPRFITAHISTLADHYPCWVVGRIVHPPDIRTTPFGRFRDASWEAFHDANGNEGVAETSGMSAANLSLPASDFHKLGGFDESFTIASSEDWELGMRARQAGIRIVYDPRIVVKHNDWAVSLDKFCERQRLYSISDVLLWHKYGAASPRERLVKENAPVDWREDRASLIAKKAIKAALAGRVGGALINASCRLTERFAPDTGLNRRAYNLAVGLSIFEGVREGLKRYGSM